MTQHTATVTTIRRFAGIAYVVAIVTCRCGYRVERHDSDDARRLAARHNGNTDFITKHMEK